MSPSELLHFELSLLLARHGKQTVLRALADRMQMSEEELKTSLRQFSEAATHRQAKHKNQKKPFSIDPILQGYPENAELLKQLNSRFENRTFLPELKDLKRFLDRHSLPTSGLKSRSAGHAQLFKILVELRPQELTNLLADRITGREFSSLGIISDEILKRHK